LFLVLDVFFALAINGFLIWVKIQIVNVYPNG